MVPEGETSKALKADAYEDLKVDWIRLGLFSHADGEGRRIRTCRPPDPKKAPEANIFVNYEVFGGPGSAGEPLGGLLGASWGPLGGLLGASWRAPREKFDVLYM